MIEVFLFVSPLGANCLKKEKEVLEWIAQNEHKVQFQLIPFLNLQMVHSYLKMNHLETKNIQFRNTLFKQMYETVLDYYAIQLQGKKKGRNFLCGVQQAIGLSGQPYSRELILSIIESLDVDMDMYKLDRKMPQIVESFRDDQQVAHEMGVTKVPSLVLFNYTNASDYGILIEEEITNLMTLTELCGLDEEVLKTNASENDRVLRLL